MSTADQATAPKSGWVVESDGFLLVDVVAEKDDSVIVKPSSGSLSKSQAEFETKKSALHTASNAVDELVFLRHFSEESVVNCLKWRFDHDLIYTSAGLVTVAINPFRQIDGLYSPEQIVAYHKSVEKLSLPHIYGVVQRAYRAMTEDRSLRELKDLPCCGTSPKVLIELLLHAEVDQSILISGLSGSGKTENGKFAIHYLSTISGGNGVLERQILVAGLLLESFGNATTILNPNSSRFGKYTKILFDRDGHMVGAEIRTYLLEKSRVSSAPENERSFHVFYQLVRGATDLALGSPDDFAYLKRKVANEDPDDAGYWKILVEQLTILGFNEEDRANISSTLAGILHLGNVSFTGGDKSSVIPNGQLEKAASFLKVDSVALQNALTTLQVRSVAEPIALNQSTAELSRDSLARELYERLFNWVVRRINAALKFEGDADDCGFIAILDISGYESLSKNSFEQLCINYTNDKLQQLFGDAVHREQEIYEEEIDWKHLDFNLNLRQAIDLLEKSENGAFVTLDEVCYRQTSTDEDLVRELSMAHAGKPNSVFHSDTKEANRFGVEHGPGVVWYNADNFILKNRDLLASSLSSLMQESGHSLIKDIFLNSTKNQSQTPRSPRLEQSVSALYLKQMADLIEAISETDCSYLKCIRANKTAKARFLDAPYVCEQIKWAGVVETITLCDKGYPVHYSFDSFLHRYGKLGKQDNNKTPAENCSAILAQSLKTGEYAVGKTLVLLGMGSQFKLDLMVECLANKNDAVQPSASFWQKTKKTFGWLFK